MFTFLAFVPVSYLITCCDGITRACSCLFSALAQQTTNPAAITGLSLRNVTVIVGRWPGPNVTHAYWDYRPIDSNPPAPNTVPVLVSGLNFQHIHDAVVDGGGVAFVGQQQPYWAGVGGEGQCINSTVDSHVDFTGSPSCILARATG
jgi:hypothetical protein